MRLMDPMSILTDSASTRPTISKYLGTPAADECFPKQGWFLGKGSIFFAGTSKTWGAGVAFVDVRSGASVVYRTHRVRWEQFLDVWSAENGLVSIPESDKLLEAIQQASTGATFRISTDGKYDTAVVIGKTDYQLLTLTTSKILPAAAPDVRYLDTIVTGLTDAPFDDRTLSDYIARLRQLAVVSSC